MHICFLVAIVRKSVTFPSVFLGLAKLKHFLECHSSTFTRRLFQFNPYILLCPGLQYHVVHRIVCTIVYGRIALPQYKDGALP